MSLANVKILGLREYENLLHEKKNLVFPIDFPLTKTQKSLSANTKSLLIDKYLKKPPKHRINYQRIGFPYPFESNFGLLASIFSELLPVEILMFSKGIPQERAIICMLNKEDLILCEEILKKKEKNSTIIYRESLKKRTLGDLKALKEEKLMEYLSKIKIEREIIGFLTCGDFSRNECKGKGIGFVAKERIQAIFKERKEFFALVRNSGSRYYYLCEVKEIRNL